MIKSVVQILKESLCVHDWECVDLGAAEADIFNPSLSMVPNFKCKKCDKVEGL